MPLRTSTQLTFTLLAINCLCICSPVTLAKNADVLADFPRPSSSNATQVIDSRYFTYTALRSLVGAPPPTQFKILLADTNTFPALRGQGVSLAVIQFPGSVVNPPHSHPQAAELLLLISGSLQVGFVDAENKLLNQTLQAGDMYIFPKGLVHYHYNFQPTTPAVAISAFGSENPELLLLPSNLFSTGIDDTILAQSFKTDIPTIQRLKASVA